MSLLTRRSLLMASGTALCLRAAPARSPWSKMSEAPDLAEAFTEQGVISLRRHGAEWSGEDVVVSTAEQRLTLGAPRSAVMRVHLRWQLKPPISTRYLGDDWERSYGTLAWRALEPERILPWYFLAHEAGATFACGVKTGARAMCCWQVDPDGVSLWLDVRNGGSGVRLGKRAVELASLVNDSTSAVRPFVAAQQFCRKLCDKPRLPAAPVYGGNNWYYAYGKSSAADIRSDSERIASFANSTSNRPFMVIDDGWSPNATAGPWTHGNERFPDMAALAADMRRIGVQPGLWVRPLFTKEKVADAWRLESPNAAKEYQARQAYTLDPTVPEVVAHVQQDLRTAVAWGYSLIKHDFSTYDLLGRWGFAMEATLTEAGWSFTDRTRTNAEIIHDLYLALREAADNSLVLGCNTVGHLGAGLFELQRTGDDTSGRDWNRTRKMGVNTLAFRGPQQGAFFAIDADCVGLTRQVPWKFNRQWLDLLARSGTPLFVSAAADAIGAEQRVALQAAFKRASQAQATGEPLDWLANNEPEKWRLDGESVSYDWFGTEGATNLVGSLQPRRTTNRCKS